MGSGLNLLFVPEQIVLTEGKISSRYILCNFHTVYQSAAFVLLTALPSNFYDGCCLCLLNIIIQQGCNGTRTEPKQFTWQIPNGSDHPYALGVGTLEWTGHVRAIM